MNNQPLEKELDPNPLVNALVEKTRAGRLKWEATAAPNTYIASVGGNTTFRIFCEPTNDFDEDGQIAIESSPVLFWLDEKGTILWDIHSYQVKGGLHPLFKLAQRLGNKLDERIEALLETVGRL